MIEIPLAVAAMLVVAFLGCIFGFGRILMGQFEKRIGERFKTQDKAREEQLRETRNRLEQDAARFTALAEKVEKLALELPLFYVRREDWIRFGASIDHKQDRLGEMVMHLAGLIKDLGGSNRARN